MQGLRWYFERLPLPGEEEESKQEKEEKGEVKGKEDEGLPSPDESASDKAPEPEDANEPSIPSYHQAEESVETVEGLPDPLDEGRMDAVGKLNTTVRSPKQGDISVVLYNTEVVKVQDGTAYLNTGGFNTPTTIRRMNQASNQYKLGFQAFLRKGIPYVTINGKTIPFQDNQVSFPLKAEGAPVAQVAEAFDTPEEISRLQTNIKARRTQNSVRNRRYRRHVYRDHSRDGLPDPAKA